MKSADRSNEILIPVGALFGSFIFSANLVVFNVIRNSKKIIVLPKKAITKEFVFYLLSIAVVVGFGFTGKAGIPFVITYITLYILYLIITILVEEPEEKEEKDVEKDLEDDFSNII